MGARNAGALPGKATFFCIGDNVRKNPDLFRRTIAAGHAIGNHTFHHLNGWHTSHDTYLENVRLCEEAIGSSSPLFRPPYGKVTRRQRRALSGKGYKLVMWDVLSADFDRTISPEKCFENVSKNLEPGSIIIFHDSEKAAANLRHALPRTLQLLKEKGFRCEKLALTGK